MVRQIIIELLQQQDGVCAELRNGVHLNVDARTLAELPNLSKKQLLIDSWVALMRERGKPGAWLGPYVLAAWALTMGQPIIIEEVHTCMKHTHTHASASASASAPLSSR
jgi:hypothetical protein